MSGDWVSAPSGDSFGRARREVQSARFHPSGAIARNSGSLYVFSN